jgi:transcriptional regulator with XRE-family HTH domain
MSQEELGRRMSDLGCEGWGRTTVQKLENDRRGSISVQELLALASVLGVPPVLLVADPRTGATVPVGAGREMSPDDALAWLVGVDAAGTGPEHVEFMTAWLRVRQAFDEWKSVRELRLRLTSKRSGDAAEMRETERMLRDAYVKAADELGRFLPDRHDRAGAFVGDVDTDAED